MEIGWYNIVRTGVQKTCHKCATTTDPIVVRGATHNTLYCFACGAYIKHANPEETGKSYLSHVEATLGTPLSAIFRYEDSENSLPNSLRTYKRRN